jgi:broad specificity phosphatase PhoE
MAVWHHLRTACDSDRTLIVTHGGPIRVLRAVQSRTALSALLSMDVPHAALIAIECVPDRSMAPGSGASRSLASAEDP